MIDSRYPVSDGIDLIPGCKHRPDGPTAAAAVRRPKDSIRFRTNRPKITKNINSCLLERRKKPVPGRPSVSRLRESACPIIPPNKLGTSAGVRLFSFLGMTKKYFRNTEIRRESIEDYLRAAFEIENESGRVFTNRLARKLGVAPASVTGMIKKLAENNLVKYQRYRGIALTENGRRLAINIIRYHRLAELYLLKMLKIPWDKVHQEAHRWEHVISEPVAAEMERALGNPRVDPHGSPIPDKHGKISPAERIPLSTLRPGFSAKISEVSDHDPALLNYLKKIGLLPGVRIIIESITPIDNLIRIRINDKVQTIGKVISDNVYVHK